MSSARSHLVSIIIPAFNEAKNIVNCLDSIAKQTYQKKEVILVDDFSTDNSAELAARESKTLKLDLKIISSKKHGERGVARNLGAKSAKGRYLLFIDSDMELGNDVISECVSVAEEENIKGIIIPEESKGEGFWAQSRKLEKRCYLGDDQIEAARFFEKKSFWEVGGWDEEMISGEDWDLTNRFRRKFAVGRIKVKIIHNEGRLSLAGVAKKKFYYASKAGVYLKRYPLKMGDLIFFIIRPAYLRNWKLLLSDPIHAAGIFILKFIELAAGGAGYLFSGLPGPY